MADVSVRELRQNLSVYLRRVERGETLDVTRRGERVAMLVPRADRMSVIDRLVVERGARRATRDLLDVEPAPADPDGPTMSELIEQDREDRV